MITTKETQHWAMQQFGISANDLIWYNGGICYNRIAVRTKAAAKKVSAAVKGQTVNGGWFHGMPLGGITKTDEGYEVYC